MKALFRNYIFVSLLRVYLQCCIHLSFLLSLCWCSVCPQAEKNRQYEINTIWECTVNIPHWFVSLKMNSQNIHHIGAKSGIIWFISFSYPLPLLQGVSKKHFTSCTYQQYCIFYVSAFFWPARVCAGAVLTLHLHSYFKYYTVHCPLIQLLKK